MAKKIFVKINNIFKIVLVIGFVLICQQIGVNKVETKTTNTNLNKTLDLHAMAIKIEEIQKNDLYTALDVYNGRLTGYAADCPLCGGTLSCNGENVLTNRITTYSDSDYGEVKIVASSTNLPCGSIVQFNLSKLSDTAITAIVLDRGVTGTALDLLVESQTYALTNVGSNQISYNVLRYGYTRDS